MIIYGVAVQELLQNYLLQELFGNYDRINLYVLCNYLVTYNKDAKNLEEYSLIEKIKRSKQLLPVIILILAVIGSIYTGVATATEAAYSVLLGL